MRLQAAAFALIGVLLVGGCRPPETAASELLQNPAVIARQSRFTRALDEQRAGGDAGVALARWRLPQTLNEVSGLALTGDGRLFAHGDEGGVVAVIDYRSGVLFKEFVVGSGVELIDYEGMTIAGDTLYMIDSKGDLYEFHEGGPGAHVPYARHKTRLEDSCEFEGVAYDGAIGSLLLACKNVKLDALKDSLVIFRWSMAGAETSRLSRLTIPLVNVTAAIESKSFHPSDIAVDPHSGNYLIIAAQEKALLEITPSGEVVFVRRLPEDHAQAEGLAITRDSVLIIGDEAVRTSAVLTLYRKP